MAAIAHLRHRAAWWRRAWRKPWVRIAAGLALSALLAWVCEYALAPVPKALCEFGQKALHGGAER